VYVFYHFVCMIILCCFFFFFSSRRRHTRCLSDWSSDVCSSDLDGCTIKLDASGAIVAATGVTEQGQGTETIMAQIAATALGVERSEERRVGKECRAGWARDE